MPDSEDPYPWLPIATVLGWLQVDDDTNGVVEACRQAAADWIEAQRPDLADLDEDDGRVFTPTPRIVQAGLLAAARLHARRTSPGGVIAFAELGAGTVLARDADITRMVGRPRPVLG